MFAKGWLELKIFLMVVGRLFQHCHRSLEIAEMPVVIFHRYHVKVDALGDRNL
jgi:hypothetical protein